MGVGNKYFIIIMYQIGHANIKNNECSMFRFDWFFYFACNQLIMNIQTSINEPLQQNLEWKWLLKKDFLFFQTMPIMIKWKMFLKKYVEPVLYRKILYLRHHPNRLALYNHLIWQNVQNIFWLSEKGSQNVQLEKIIDTIQPDDVNMIIFSTDFLEMWKKSF